MSYFVVNINLVGYVVLPVLFKFKLLDQNLDLP